MSKVVWYYEGEEVEIDYKRTPKLGWNTLTMLEKLLDSVKTGLCIQEKKEVKDFTRIHLALNKALAITRNEIEINKKLQPNTLLKSCEFRETKRTRCNYFPTRYDLNFGKYLCKKHHTNFEGKK